MEEDFLKSEKQNHETELEKERIEKKINTNVQECSSIEKKGTKRTS